MTERRKFQLGVVEVYRCTVCMSCDQQHVILCVHLQYMLKFNDVKTKRGVDFAEHLLGFYQAQEGYFKDGNTLLQALKLWEAKLKKENGEVWWSHDS